MPKGQRLQQLGLIGSPQPLHPLKALCTHTCTLTYTHTLSCQGATGHFQIPTQTNEEKTLVIRCSLLCICMLFVLQGKHTHTHSHTPSICLVFLVPLVILPSASFKDLCQHKHIHTSLMGLCLFCSFVSSSLNCSSLVLALRH